MRRCALGLLLAWWFSYAHWGDFRPYKLYLMGPFPSEAVCKTVNASIGEQNRSIFDKTPCWEADEGPTLREVEPTQVLPTRPKAPR